MKMIRALLIAALLLICNAASAVQYSPVLSTTSPYPGLTMLANANSSYAALLSNNSGATAPSYGVAGTIFMNTSSNLFEVYNGTNWLNAGTFSTAQFSTVNNGVPYTIPASTGSSNAYVVTYSPVPTALVTGQHYPFISNFANTTTATENVNSLGAKQIKKQGSVGLISADIPSGAVVDTVYDGTFMQMISQVGNSSVGTVSSIATTSPICGGTITGTGTLVLCSQANNTVLANISGGSAAPSATGAPVVTSLGITGTGASATGFIGMHSTAAGGLSLSTSAAGDAFVLSTAGVVTTGTWNGTVIGPSYLAVATSSAEGIGKPDNSTITVSSGIWSATGTLPAAFAVGSYVMASPGSPISNTAAGATVSGSSLTVYMAGYDHTQGPIFTATGDTLSGTWRCMQTMNGNGIQAPIGLFLRIS